MFVRKSLGLSFKNNRKEISLGDRWIGKIELEGDLLKVGKDKGRLGNPKDERFQILLNFNK